MTFARSRTRPIEIWKDRTTGWWQWRCRSCGLLRGGQRASHADALRIALAHCTT